MSDSEQDQDALHMDVQPQTDTEHAQGQEQEPEKGSDHDPPDVSEGMNTAKNSAAQSAEQNQHSETVKKDVTMKESNENDNSKNSQEEKKVEKKSGKNNDKKDGKIPKFKIGKKDAKNENGQNQGQKQIKDQEDDRTNLIINYLPQDLSDGDFESLFKEHGQIKAAKIVRHKNTGESYGFGFVEYETHKDALRAIDALNGLKLNDKKLKVAFARPTSEDIKNAKLYIKNLPEHFGEEELRKTFKPFGTIIESKIVSKRNAVAFVLYDTRREAEQAMNALNGKILDSKCTLPLEIRFVGHDGRPAFTFSQGSNASRSNMNNGQNNFHHHQHQNPQYRQRQNPSYNPPAAAYQNQVQGQNLGQPAYLHSTLHNGETPTGIRVQSQYVVPYVAVAGAQQHGYNVVQSTPAAPAGYGPIKPSMAARQQTRYSPYAPATVPGQATVTPTPAVVVSTTTTATPSTTSTATAAQQYAAAAAAAGYPTTAGGPPANPYAYASLGLNPYQHAAAMQQPMMHASTMYPAVAIQGQAGGLAQQYQQYHNQYNVNNSTVQGHQEQGSGPVASGGNAGNAPGHTLFVYNIGALTGESNLIEPFQAYGTVVRIDIPKDPANSDTNKGYAFVTMAERDQAMECIKQLNGRHWEHSGKPLQVRFKK